MLRNTAFMHWPHSRVLLLKKQATLDSHNHAMIVLLIRISILYIGFSIMSWQVSWKAYLQSFDNGSHCVDPLHHLAWWKVKCQHKSEFWGNVYIYILDVVWKPSNRKAEIDAEEMSQVRKGLTKEQINPPTEKKKNLNNAKYLDRIYYYNKATI